MQNNQMGELYIKNSDESLKKFADFSFLMYIASKSISFLNFQNLHKFKNLRIKILSLF